MRNPSSLDDEIKIQGKYFPWHCSQARSSPSKNFGSPLTQGNKKSFQDWMNRKKTGNLWDKQETKVITPDKCYHDYQTCDMSVETREDWTGQTSQLVRKCSKNLVWKHPPNRKPHCSTLEDYEETPVFIPMDMTEDVVKLVAQKLLGITGYGDKYSEALQG